MVKLRRSGFIVWFSAIISIAFSGCVTAGTLPKPFKMIPQPHIVELVGGTGLEFGGLPVLLPGRFIVCRNLTVRLYGSPV